MHAQVQKTAATREQARPRNDLRARVDAYMRAAVANDRFTGSVLVARDGAPLIDTAYGMASYELGVPNTPRTVFHIASLTKQFTAMAIMQLRDRGKLKVDDPICTYIANCPPRLEADHDPPPADPRLASGTCPVCLTGTTT